MKLFKIDLELFKKEVIRVTGKWKTKTKTCKQGQSVNGWEIFIKGVNVANHLASPFFLFLTPCRRPNIRTGWWHAVIIECFEIGIFKVAHGIIQGSKIKSASMSLQDITKSPALAQVFQNVIVFQMWHIVLTLCGFLVERILIVQRTNEIAPSCF